MGRVPQRNFILDHARANLFCEKKTAAPLRMRIEKMDVAGAGKQVLIDGGHFIWEEAPAEYASSILDSISRNAPQHVS